MLLVKQKQKELLQLNLKFSLVKVKSYIFSAKHFFNFVTFFGGSDKTWEPIKDEYIYFDDFIFSMKDIPFEIKK